MPVTTSSVTAGRRCHLPLKGKAFGPPRAAAPTDNAPDLPPGGKVARPEAVTDEGTTYGAFPVNGIPQSPPCGGDSPLSQGGRARMVRPTYNRRTLPPVGRFHTFIGNLAPSCPILAAKPPLRGLSCKGFVKIFPTGGVPHGIFSGNLVKSF